MSVMCQPPGNTDGIGDGRSDEVARVVKVLGDFVDEPGFVLVERSQVGDIQEQAAWMFDGFQAHNRREFLAGNGKLF